MIAITNAERKNNANRLHELQRHYDILHHKRRVLWLRETPCMWSDGSAVPEYFRINLLNSSLRVIKEGMSCNSVDLNDSNYLAVLDDFNSCIQGSDK
ncbi:hypothetical protein CIG23_17560 [Raoultella planticola]|nr:hypothetical protein CIG23_17560 [Raoultella planticola]